MKELATYQLEGAIATIAMDDGKASVLSLEMLGQIDAALDRAAADGAVVVLTGHEGIFSGGFDLGALGAGGATAATMLTAGFELAERILSFATPVVIACSGHAVAMGVFLVLSGDYRLGAAGPYKITANEVVIGMTMPRAPWRSAVNGSHRRTSTAPLSSLRSTRPATSPPPASSTEPSRHPTYRARHTAWPPS